MWTTDTFLQNLDRFSALKGQGQDNPTATNRPMAGMQLKMDDKSGNVGRRFPDLHL